MREITAGELSKILEEHNVDEGEKTDLSGANLRGAFLSRASCLLVFHYMCEAIKIKETV